MTTGNGTTMDKDNQFIVSTKKINGSKKVSQIFIKGDYEVENDCFLIFEGVLYPENKYKKKELLTKILKEGIQFIKSLKGYFSGVFFESKKNEFYIFNDKLGIGDVFVYKKENELIISGNFNDICENLKIEFNDFDQQAIAEFLIFGYPLFEKTFVKELHYLPLASLWNVDGKLRLTKSQYWQYKLQIDNHFDADKAIEELDTLMDNAIKRIKDMNSFNTLYGLGLSGGLDSRLIAFYAIKNKLKLITFIFGKENSDAYNISKKIAKRLKLVHSEVGYNKEFIKYAKIHVAYNPMVNLYHSWYYAIYEKLPKFDILLSGFNAGNQFGDKFSEKYITIKNYNELIKSIFGGFDEINAAGRINNSLKTNYLPEIIKEMKNKLQTSQNKKYWQKIVEFNYTNRQLKYLKNNPSYSFYGRYKHYSAFTDFDLVEFLLKIPFKDRVNRNFYNVFHKAKLKSLSKIRPERELPYTTSRMLRFIYKLFRNIDLKVLKTKIFYKPSHKSVSKWLSDNPYFKEQAKKILSEEDEYFAKIFKENNVFELMGNLKTNNDYRFFFGILTVKLWLNQLRLTSVRPKMR